MSISLMAAYFQATGDSEGVDTFDGVVTGCSACQVSIFEKTVGDSGNGVSKSLSVFS